MTNSGLESPRLTLAIAALSWSSRTGSPSSSPPRVARSGSADSRNADPSRYLPAEGIHPRISSRPGHTPVLSVQPSPAGGHALVDGEDAQAGTVRVGEPVDRQAARHVVDDRPHPGNLRVVGAAIGHAV